jgi:hypothetical protein
MLGNCKVGGGSWKELESKWPFCTDLAGKATIAVALACANISGRIPYQRFVALASELQSLFSRSSGITQYGREQTILNDAHR